MSGFFKNVAFGMKELVSKGPIHTLSQFKNKSNFGSSSDYAEMEMGELMIFGFIFVTLAIAIIFYSVVAVGKIVQGDSEYSRNVRLGMYVLLVFTSGNIGWIYIIMWLAGVKL